MELGDGDVTDLLMSDHISLAIKQYAVSEMINLVNRQIESGLYCVDIKPPNFIYKKMDDEYQIMMIDFGIEYCQEKGLPKVYYTIGSKRTDKQARKLFKMMLLLQLMYTILKIIPSGERCEIIRPILDDPVITKAISYEPGSLESVINHILRYDNSFFGQVFRYYIGGATDTPIEEVSKSIVDTLDHYNNKCI